MIKTARQLKDLIRNLSKDKSADAQVLMRNYMMERFLERISLSEYRDQFIADLRAALAATARKRGTERNLTDALGAFDEVEADRNMEKLWKSYRKKFPYAAGLSWHTVMESVRGLYRLTQG